jgi:beta-N-acetylhexosaminidase
MGGDLESRLGELLFIGLPGPELTQELRERLRAIGPSGVILFARNLPDAATGARLARAVHETLGEPGLPALVGVDEEGGIVSRLSGFWEVPPNAHAVAASGGPPLVQDLAARTGRRLLALGANLDFAPVLDIHSNPANPVIGVRSSGTTASQVTACGLAAMEGFRSAGVIPVVKHFPGHGDTALDSHVALPRCTAGDGLLRLRELRPFEAAVAAGAPVVMTSHVLFPALDPDPRSPATISHAIVTGLLRERMRFRGVVCTDALEMEGVRGLGDWGDIAVRAVEAGCDLLLYGEFEPGPEAALEGLRAALRSGRLAPERVEESLARVRRLRAERAAPAPPLTDRLLWEARDVIPPAELERIAAGAIRTLQQGAGDVPLRGLIDVLEVGRPEGRTPIADLLRAHGAVAREHVPDPAGWPRKIEGSALLTLAARTHPSEDEERLARAWLHRFPETVTVACLNPHVADAWEETRTLLATFDNSPASRRALAARLVPPPEPQRRGPPA